VAAFFLGKPIAVAAMIGAAILLLDRIRPEKVYQLIDWPLLLMFSGLFIVVAGFEIHVVKNWGIENWSSIQTSPVILVSLVSAALSNLVSNVPAVLLFKPIVPLINDPQKAWLALAMSSTLAGNLTLLGSVANLIVVENAKRAGVTIRFLEYLKTGLPLTFVTLLVGMAWLYFV
jgi:Na+/H+ antiporter NhaD/arsenite permease-like protein